ncbi:MAG: YceD family protein [Azonexus sp.]
MKRHFVLTWKAKNNIISRLSRNGSRLKRISDAFVFAREGRVLEGELAVSGLERLHDLLAEVSGSVSFRLQGFKSEHGELMLHLEVGGTIPLACQRCLKAIPFDLDVDNLLEIIPEGADMSQDELEDDTRDFLPLAGELDVAEFVEDEILLALPVAPRHEKCGLPGVADAGERINPFAALAGLKGKPN